MPWGLLVKYVLPALAIIGVVWWWDHGVAKQAMAECRAEFAEYKQQQSDLNAKQEAKNRETEQQMDADRRAREALAAELGARVDSYNDLAVRVRAATAIHPGVVPKASPGGSPAVADTGGASCAERINESLQRVFTEGRACGIALATLRSKEICECATSAGPH